MKKDDKKRKHFDWEKQKKLKNKGHKEIRKGASLVKVKRNS